MQTRYGNLVIADLVGSTAHTCGLQQEPRDLGSGLGDTMGKARGTAVTEADGLGEEEA
jgi:hypothetical protein